LSVSKPSPCEIELSDKNNDTSAPVLRHHLHKIQPEAFRHLGFEHIHLTFYEAALAWLAEVQMLDFPSRIKTHMTFNASSSDLTLYIV
jgi:hypothetical protein